MIPTASCPRCGYRLFGRVSVRNLYSELTAAVKNSSIEFKLNRLHADGVNVELESLFCPNCHRDVAQDSLVFKCAISGISDVVKEFVILRFISPGGRTYNKPYVVHKKIQEKIIADMAKENYLLKSAVPLDFQAEGE